MDGFIETTLTDVVIHESVWDDHKEGNYSIVDEFGNKTDVCSMCFGNEANSWIHNISFDNNAGILTFSDINSNVDLRDLDITGNDGIVALISNHDSNKTLTTMNYCKLNNE